MAVVTMDVERCGCNGWYSDGKRDFKRVSRWIKVKNHPNPTPRNSLWYYAMDGYGHNPFSKEFDPSEGLYLDYFTFDGRNYAIEQFWALGNPFYSALTLSYEDKKGNRCFLSGVDSEPLYDPLYIEISDGGEYVRVYKEA